MNCSRGGRLFPLCLCALVCLMAQLGGCNVVLMANNTTLSFNDVEATFTPEVKGSGVNGVIYNAEPLDACSPLRKKAVEGPASPFALIIRGGCQFDDKVRNAQNAGFKAVIVYDNKDNGILVSMTGSSPGIHIYAVFISKASGEVLKKYSGQTDAQLWIISTQENSAWSIMAISFISLLAMSAVLATCFFVRRHQIRRDRTRLPATREFHGMSSQLVKAMPSLIFTKVQEDNCTSSTCAICLGDYSVGEQLRVLPCRHKFHAACVDLWLTSWRTFCPVCKQDANAGTSNPPESEYTPLLSSAIHLPAESTALSSFRSMVAASSPRSISRHPSSQSISRTHSNSCISHTPNPGRSYSNSPAISTSRSNADLADMSSRWSHFTPSICALPGRGKFVSAGQHQVYITTCLRFWLRIFRSVRWFAAHPPFWVQVSKLLRWLFRAAVPLPEAPHGVRSKPVHHGAPVTPTDPAAARWRVRDKPISCGIDSVAASGIPAALHRFGCKLICRNISSVTTGVLIALTNFTTGVHFDAKRTG